jgi:PBSX family phage terminase large subunit
VSNIIDLDAFRRVVSPKQVEAIVESTARVNVWDGAVRSGKTWSSLVRWLKVIREVELGPGELLVMIGKTKDTLKRNCLEWLAAFLGTGMSWTPGADTCAILGKTVHLIGANDVRSEQKIRGSTIRAAYGDEGSTWPEDFFLMLLSRLSPPGAWLGLTTNPEGPVHWFKKQVIDRVAELGWRRFQFRLDDNPHLSEEFKAQLSAEYTGVWYKRYILGLWVAAEGAIYDMWDEARHVVRTLPRMLDWWWVGVDYGTTNPFAALLLGVGVDERGAERLYLADEYRWDSVKAMRAKTDVELSQGVRTWVAAAPARISPGAPLVVPQWWAVDPSAASFKAQLRADQVRGVIDADNTVLRGIRVVSSLLSLDRLRVHERCKGWVEEAPGYVWDPKATEKGLDEPLKLNDHSLDGGRYGVMAARPVWRPWLRSVPDVEKEAA